MQVRTYREKHDHIVAMWPECMAGEPTTFAEFMAEPAEEREYYYRWIRREYNSAVLASRYDDL